MFKLFSSEKEKQQITDFKDPFKKDLVSAVHIHIYNYAPNPTSVSGSVEFKNGNTCGEQKFKSESFTELVQEIETFINSL